MIEIDCIKNFSDPMHFFTALVLFEILLELLKINIAILIRVNLNEYLSQFVICCIWHLVDKINHYHFAKERPVIDFPHLFQNLHPDLFRGWLLDHLGDKGLEPRMSQDLLGPNSPSVIFVQHF